MMAEDLERKLDVEGKDCPALRYLQEFYLELCEETNANLKTEFTVSLNKIDRKECSIED